MSRFSLIENSFHFKVFISTLLNELTRYFICQTRKDRFVDCCMLIFCNLQIDHDEPIF